MVHGEGDHEDIKYVKREFKYMFYGTKQTKIETLFDWIERIIALSLS